MHMCTCRVRVTCEHNKRVILRARTPPPCTAGIAWSIAAATRARSRGGSGACTRCSAAPRPPRTPPGTRRTRRPRPRPWRETSRGGRRPPPSRGPSSGSWTPRGGGGGGTRREACTYVSTRRKEGGDLYRSVHQGRTSSMRHGARGGCAPPTRGIPPPTHMPPAGRPFPHLHVVQLDQRLVRHWTIRTASPPTHTRLRLGRPSPSRSK